MLFIHSEKNIKIAVYDLNHGAPKTILLVHGWPLSETIFEYQKDMLINAGFRVVTFDFRGFGNSDIPAAGYSYDHLAFDLYQVVKALNLTSFILAGFSIGSAVICRYMSKYKGYGVNKLCLMSAPVPRLTQKEGFTSGVTSESMEDFIRKIAQDRPSLCRNLADDLLNNKHSQAVKDWFELIALSSSGIGTIQTAFSLRDEDCSADLKNIKVPVGIFHGEKDKIIPFDLALIQHQMIQDSYLFSFEKSGHAVFYDDLETFNRIFLKFII